MVKQVFKVKKVTFIHLALHMLAMSSDVNAIPYIELLIKNGADINANVDGKTPLWTHCANTIDMKLVNILLKHGANINQAVLNKHSSIY